MRSIELQHIPSLFFAYVCTGWRMNWLIDWLAVWAGVHGVLRCCVLSALSTLNTKSSPHEIGATRLHPKHHAVRGIREAGGRWHLTRALPSRFRSRLFFGAGEKGGCCWVQGCRELEPRAWGFTVERLTRSVQVLWIASPMQVFLILPRLHDLCCIPRLLCLSDWGERWEQGAKARLKGLSIGAWITTNATLGVPEYHYGIVGPKTLCYSLRPLHYTLNVTLVEPLIRISLKEPYSNY